LEALAACLRTTARVLSGDLSSSDFSPPKGSTSRADETIDAIRPHVGRFWKI
jgi:hypothetical protein